MTKPTKWHVRPAKTQISPGIRPVWSESSLCKSVAKDPTFLHADSKDSDQTGWMPRWSESSLGAQSFCWFCHEGAHLLVWPFLGFFISVLSKNWTHLTICSWNEPAHEIMAFFVLRKLILQMCMRSHPEELDVWFLVGPFVTFHTSCVWTVKALARLCRCAGLPELRRSPMWLSTKISCAGSN